jgi:hypothetical protein
MDKVNKKCLKMDNNMLNIMVILLKENLMVMAKLNILMVDLIKDNLIRVLSMAEEYMSIKVVKNIKEILIKILNKIKIVPLHFQNPPIKVELKMVNMREKVN